MAKENTPANKSEVIVHLPLSAIQVEWSWNSRTIRAPGQEGKAEILDDEYIGLKSSIEDKGQDTPVYVRPIKGKADKYTLMAGFRRYSILLELSRPTIKAVVLDVTDEEARSINLRENTRQDLNVADRAWGVYQLYAIRASKAGADATITDAAIAREVGLSVPFTNNLLRVYKMGAADVLKTWRADPKPLSLMTMVKITTPENGQTKRPVADQVAAYREEIKKREEKGPGLRGRGWVKGVAAQAEKLGMVLGCLEAKSVIRIDSKKLQAFDFAVLFEKIPDNATAAQRKQVADALGAGYQRALEGFDDDETDDDSEEESATAN